MPKKKRSPQTRAVASSTSIMKEHYLERVRSAMTLTEAECLAPRSEYIEALEEIHGEVEAMLAAAREEQQAEEAGEA